MTYFGYNYINTLTWKSASDNLFILQLVDLVMIILIRENNYVKFKKIYMNLVKSIEEDKRVETRNPFVMLGVNLITKTRWNHIYSSQSNFDSELLQQPIPNSRLHQNISIPLYIYICPMSPCVSLNSKALYDKRWLLYSFFEASE